MAKAKTFKFKLIDRILLNDILPEKGDFLTLITKKVIKDKVSLTQEEIEKYEIKVLPNGSIQWNKDGIGAEFNIELNEAESNLIRTQLKSLEEKKELIDGLLGLYELFCK